MVAVKSLLSKSSVRNGLIIIGAVVLVFLGLWLGGDATRAILDSILSILFSPEFLRAVFISTTPLLLAALGGLISELSGVLNMALEAMMLIGAFAAYAAADHSGNVWIGLLAASLAGMLVGGIHAFFTITLRCNQIVTAVALNLFALAVTALSFRMLYAGGAFVFAPSFQPLHVPFLSDLPYLGIALFDQNILVYLTLLLVPIMSFVLYKTSWGLTLRSVGEHPLAASTSGINVNRVRYIAVLLSGAIAGISGSALVSASNINVFQENMSAGRGFIAFAAEIFGRYTPGGVLSGSLLFGLGDALQIRLQAYGVQVPYQLLMILPYAITLIALVVFMKHAHAPAASGVPYSEEE
jgi:ABC-type uncharacterized transport system permease subunit